MVGMQDTMKTIHISVLSCLSAGVRGASESEKAGKRETHEAQIFRLANSNVMSEVAVSVLSSFVFTAAHAAALSVVSLYLHCSASSELVYTYTTPKLKSTISPILTWSCSFKLQNIKTGYKASAMSSTAPKPKQALAPDSFSQRHGIETYFLESTHTTGSSNGHRSSREGIHPTSSQSVYTAPK